MMCELFHFSFKNSKLSLPFQLYEKSDSEEHDGELDDNKATGSRDMEQVQEDSGESEPGEPGNSGRAVESKDEDPEATKQYWEVKWKKEGVWKVNHLPLCFELCSHAFLFSPRKKSCHS